MRARRPYQLAWLETNGRGWLCVKGDPAVVTQLMDLPGAEVVGSLLAPNGYLRVPAAREAVMAVEAVAAPTTVSREYLAQRPRLVSFDQGPAQAAISRLKLARQPQAHQLEFCSFAMGRRSAYNASEQGTGKTLVGWLMAKLWGSQRTLIITEKGLMEQWLTEADLLWSPANLRPIISEALTGPVMARAERLATMPTAVPTAVVLNYEMVYRLQDCLLEWAPKTLICDEAWRLKSMQAQVTRSMVKIADQADHVLLMAGTPIGNNVGDLWSQLRIMDPSWEHLPYHDFMQRFCRYRREQYGAGLVRLIPVGCLDPANLVRRLEPYWYRALRATVGDMPPTIHHKPTRLSVPPATKTLYSQVKEHGEAALGHETSLADDRVVMMRLHQICGGHLPQYRLSSCTEAGLNTEEEADQMDWQLERIEPWPKVEWLKAWAQAHLTSDPTVRAVVWVRFNAELHRLVEALAPIVGSERVAGVWGGTGDQELEEIKESFNSRHPEGVQVIVAQLAKLCAGHNLPAGDHHVFYSNSFSYLQRSQAEGRSTRLGRTTPVQFWDVVMKDTLDEAILLALDRKQDLTTRLAVETVGGQPCGHQ